MTGWLIAGGILFLLAILPLGVRFRYNEQGFAMKILAGPFKIPFSIPKMEKSPKDTPEKEKKKPKESKKPRKMRKKAAAGRIFFPSSPWGWTFWETCGGNCGSTISTSMWSWQERTRRTWVFFMEKSGQPWPDFGQRWSGLSSSGGKMWKSPATLPPRKPWWPPQVT